MARIEHIDVNGEVIGVVDEHMQPIGPEIRRAPIVGLTLPPDIGIVYTVGQSSLIQGNNHGLFVMLGDRPVAPEETHLDLASVEFVPNPDGPGIGIAIGPALRETLDIARRRNPEAVILGYGTVAAYQEDAQHAFQAGMRVHLVGGGQFQPVVGQRRLIDPNIITRPGFAVVTPDGAGNSTGVALSVRQGRRA